MNRESESCLIEFCVAQRDRFDWAAWSRSSSVTAPERATVARYLAGIDWYGHRAAFLAFAARVTQESFADLVRQTGFDPSRFGSLLKAHLRHAGRSVAA